MLRRIGFLAALVVLAGNSSWAGIVQSFSFSFSQDESGVGSQTFLPSGFSTGDIVLPFNPTLGQLIDFSVSWSVAFDFNGTTGDQPGAVSEGAAGIFSLAGTPYSGDGNGNGNGTGPNSFLDLQFSVTHSDTFLVSDSGIVYNPALLASVAGGSSFALAWDAPFNVIPGGSWGNWTVSANGAATITYDYVPEPSQAIPLLLAAATLASLRRRLQSRCRV